MLQALFPSHCTFDGGRDRGAVVFDLLGTICEVNVGALADIFAVGAFIGIQKMSLVAKMVNQHHIEIDHAGFYIYDQLL